MHWKEYAHGTSIRKENEVCRNNQSRRHWSGMGATVGAHCHLVLMIYVLLSGFDLTDDQRKALVIGNG